MRILSLIIITAFFCSCKTGNLQEKLGKTAKQCARSSCTLDISKFTDFKWDKMYVFNSAVSKEVVDSTIGINYPYYIEFTKPLIFTKKNKIVYYENNPIDIEKLLDREVIFDYPDSLKSFTYTPQTAIFNTKTMTQGNVEYYFFHQEIK